VASPGRLALLAIGLVGVATGSPAFAGTQDGARVAMHMKAHTVKATTTCTMWSPNTQKLPCSEYVTNWIVGQNCDVYLVVGHGDPTAGIAGVSCRIQYDNVVGRGVDVFGWTLCADQEAVGAGAFGSWPESGGSNTITWNPTTNCQRTEIGDEGVHAVMGAFYVYAYGTDFLTISPVENNFAIKDCQGATTSSYYAPPSAWFSTSGYEYGHNPCEYSSYVPGCSVSPDEVNFGSIWANAYRDSTIPVRNERSTTIQGTWSLSGASFSLRSSGDPFTLAPGATMPVTVRFDPAGHGTAEGWLATGPCRGIKLLGYATPTCRFTPNRLDFASTAIGETRTLPVVLRNVHPALVSGTLSLSGNDFRLGAGPSTYSLAPGDSLAIDIDFRPTAAGARAGGLSAGPICPSVYLRGDGLPACGVVPTTRNFGTIIVGTSSDLNFTVTSNLQQRVEGQVTASAPPFRILAGGEPYSLSKGGAHTFTVRFEPQEALAYNGTISFGSPLGTISVSGTGKLPLSGCLTLPGSDLNFGLAQLGVGRTETLRFANTGEGSLTLTLSGASLSPNFSLPNGEGPFAMVAGETLDVPVRYAPLTTGVHVATLVANSPCTNVRLIGFSQRSPVACIAAASELDFGDVPVGASREMDFYLFNYSGERALGYVSAPCSDFALTSDTDYELAWADSQRVSVRFAPRTMGAQTCAVAVTGSCGDTIEIAGYGIAPPDTARARPWLFAASRPDEGVQRLVYEILSAARIEIIVFDVVGHELARFDEGVRAPGRFEVSWDARQHSSGVYFVRIEAARASVTRRVLLLR
jgi:hypothetical protein